MPKEEKETPKKKPTHVRIGNGQFLIGLGKTMPWDEFKANFAGKLNVDLQDAYEQLGGKVPAKA